MGRRWLDFDRLLEIRPRNESETHYLLKNIGRAWLWQQGCRVIGTEVSVGPHIVDVMGLGTRYVEAERSKELRKRIKQVREELYLPEAEGLDRDGRQKLAEVLAEKHDLRPWNLTSSYTHTWTESERVTKGVEAKASLQDFRSGFCTEANYCYVIAPKGIVPVDEVPKRIGLVEVDFDVVEVLVTPVVKCLGVQLVKRATYNSSTLGSADRMLYRIAQQNTQETMFWHSVRRE